MEQAYSFGALKKFNWGIGAYMEKKTSRTLNELLVKLFNNMMDMEERAIITEEFQDITNNDMHIIEAIGIDEPRRMQRALALRSAR